MTTKIEWCQETWNPVTGCTKISEGCKNCYAERMAKRLAGRYGYPADDPFKVTFHPDRLDKPLKWRKPRRIFVCSMGDLFHSDVSETAIDFVMDRIWAAECNHHTFLVLTKRPGRMRDYFKSTLNDQAERPNLWIGVTAENQKRYDERWTIAANIPAAVRFVSGEPLLGEIDIRKHQIKPDWFIAGGESGPGARPMHPNWARGLRDQCLAAGVPYFFKQFGEYVDEFHPESGSIPIKKWDTSFVELIKDERGIPFDYKGVYMVPVGKKKAGRLLDGRTWDQYPT
jgi:protein gp37